jgi:hypothetical protein
MQPSSWHSLSPADHPEAARTVGKLTAPTTG